MGFFNKSKTETADSSASQVTATASEPVERSIMRDMVAKLQAAQAGVAKAERKVSQLEHAVAVGAKTDAAFQSLDSAESLERIASGDMSDTDVSAMLLRQQAAKTAQALLPAARQQLEAGRAAVAHLDKQVHTSVVNLLTLEANKVAKRYLAAWIELKHNHDLLLGISHALPPSESHMDTIARDADGIDVPGFKLPALGNAFRLEHRLNEAKVERTRQTWQDAVDRLMADPDANVTEILNAG
jgi:hypothetical protein